MGGKVTVTRLFLLAMAVLCTALTTAVANVTVSPLFGNSMVIQRGKPVLVYGTAAPNENVTVTFNGQSPSTTASAQGSWQVTLNSMTANTTGQTMTITGNNTITITNVVIGDVWVCSGQSNMAWNLGSCNRQTQDVDTANFPGIRHFWVPLNNLGEPTKNLVGNWAVCSPSTAAGFSAVAFYFGRKIYQDQGAAIPIGLIATTVGGTCIDPWLGPEGCTDISVLSPLYSQSILPWGPFSLYNGMVYPLAPYGVKGAIWYQGESRETTNQSVDSYYLKEKALQQGWKRVWGMDDMPLYIVLLANWLDAPVGQNVAPDMPGATWADTRIQQMNVLGLPHGGVASAMDIGNAADIHPTDKLDVGERLAFWALKNDYGRSTVVPSGPVLKNVTVSGNKAICTFDYVGAGLMVGSKTPYLPTTEVIGGTLAKFSIAGSNGVWYDATAVINGATVELTSASVVTPTKVAYACWTNPAGANLYNRDGLPAAPFYVDDISAKYTVTASAGTGGTISPTGATTYLKRQTALYTITPNAGYYIQNVTVDGTSVGAVKYYTFDPLYANHTIAATFTTTAQSYTVTASAASGGTISPSGAQSVAQAGSKTFAITPNAGCTATVSVDGCPMGQRSSYTFADVRANHTISAAFTCTINAQSGYGGTISPSGTTVVNYGSNQTFSISPSAGFAISKVTVDGTNVGAVSTYTFTNVTTSHTITATFSGTGGGGSVPQQSQMLFSCLVDSLPASGAISSWPTYIPSGQSLSPLGTPTVATIDERKFVHNVYNDYDGFSKGTYSSSIPCNGGSIVLVAKPVRFGADSNWNAIVDVFYDRMLLGIMNGSGRVCVRRNGSMEYSTATIPDGQTTILSLIVQPDGSYKVYANGTETMSIATNGTFTSLVPGVAGSFANYINVGRGGDAWATFNGEYGDVFVYKVALTSAERVDLETYLANRLTGGGGGTSYTITATAGTGGTISPSGAVSVNQGANQTFTITPDASYQISDVTVDGVSQGAIGSYTFTNVTTTHTISASFNVTGGSIPRTGDLLFSCVTDSFPTSGSTGNWPSYIPSGQTLTMMGTPIVEMFSGVKWEQNLYAEGDGYHYNRYASPIPCNGASIVVAAKPLRNTTSTPWISIVDIFYDRLCLGIHNDNGLVVVKRNGITNDNATAIPEGQITILSLVVQPDGTYKVWANGTEVMNNTSLSALTSLDPNQHIADWGDPDFVHHVNVGRNNPDGWTTFNGNIGDVFVYKVALTNLERQQLEAQLTSKFIAGTTTYTITASAGANGTISPSGAVSVNSGANQAFGITPDAGYVVSSVTVDGVNQGAITSYTFTNVTANHTISATFVSAGPTPVAHYQFENNVLDTMGTYNGTAYNSPTYVTGKVGQAISFNGSNQYVSIARPVSTNFSIAFWVKTTQTSPSGTQWYNGKGLVDGEMAGTKNDFGISYLNSKVAFGVGNPDTTIQSTSNINTGNWVFVTCTRNSTTGEMKIYINGTLETTRATGPTGAKSAPTTLTFGCLHTIKNYFAGSIDGLRIYNSVLTAADVSSLYNGGVGLASFDGYQDDGWVIIPAE